MTDYFTFILLQWVENVVVGWLELVYCGSRGQLSSADAAIQTMVSNNLNQTYMTALYHTYTTTRIDQLFNIVIGKWIYWSFLYYW